MTTPANTIERGGKRYYHWPALPPYELEVESVTTIKKNLPNEKLIGWAARKTAEFAVRHVDSWRGLPEDAAIKLLKDSRFLDMNRKGNRGTAVHSFLDAYAKGEPVPDDIDPEVEGFYRAAVRFLEDHKVEIEHAEATIYSRTHGYAGSTDVIGTLQLREWDKPYRSIIDYKTSKDIYLDTVYQLVAYAKGDFIGHEDGKTEIPMPEVTKGVIVQPQRDGTYAYKDFNLTDEAFEVFLALKKVGQNEAIARSVAGRKRTVKVAA